MKNFNYIKWVTDNKHNLLTEQSGSGSYITCYGCEQGQIITNSNTFTGSYDPSNGIVFNYCGSTSTGNTMTAWFDSVNNTYLSNCGSNTSASAGSGSASTGSASTGSGFLSGSANTGSAGTTTTGMGGVLPTNLKDPCKEFKTIYPNINAAKTFCKKCETNSSNPMCKCCKGLRENNTQNKIKTKGLRNYNTMKKRKNQLTKGQLRNIINESIREVIIEQTTSECGQINALQVGNKTFAGCCEMGFFGQPPGTPTWNNPFNINSPECKDIQNSAMAINPNFYNCCDPDWGTNTELDCENNEWVLANPNASGECWVCRDTGQNCVTLNQAGMTAATALATGLNLYNDDVTCNAQSECGGGSGNRCSDPVGSYNPGAPDHNEDWGMGCWFCHPEPEHPDFPGCTMITGTAMDQVNAYTAFTAGTSGLYTTNAMCQADPITKCGDDNGGATEQCQCCTKGGPISMVQQVVPGNCASLNNAATGTYNCQPSPPFGGTIKDCKKPGTGIPTNPTLGSKMKPDAGDMKRAIREILNRLK